MPFQTTNPFLVRQKTAPKAAKSHSPHRSLWLSLLAGSLTLIVLLWLFRQMHWIPEPLRNLLPLPGFQDRIFIGNPGMNQEQARALYRKALVDLQAGADEQALSGFKQLESVYPGLEDWLWLHEAEAYVGLGNEWAVQKKLNNLLEQHSNSTLKAVSLYRLGQSRFRGSEWEKAEETFRQVRRDFPKSDYATGSLYYLGAVLAKSSQPGTQSEAVSPLKTYLSVCSDCKFSGNAADLLEKLLPQPDSEAHGLIGLADAAASKDLQKTLLHLSKGPFPQTWLALGKMQIRAGQKQAGLETLMRGLPKAKDTETARSAIDLIIAGNPERAAKLASLNRLANQHLPVGGDYVLWRLAELDPGNAVNNYEDILRDYPQGDYAPESSWLLLWPMLANGRTSEFLRQGRQYVVKYPYARSAPKALFWLAKVQEDSATGEAVKLYQRLLTQYPASYYAFRADGRLKALKDGKPDPGWRTNGSRAYPPQNADLNVLNILPPEEALGPAPWGPFRRSVGEELQAIGAAEDVKLLVTETTGALPPAVESWAAQVSGDKAKGLRIMRDALEKQAKERFLNADGQSFKPPGTVDELKLLYPVYFPENIHTASQRTGLDPFLIQALMREESYFNEFAISTSNARGLMQLLPATAQDVANWESMTGFRVSDLFLPEVNIRLGSRYLGWLHETFNDNSMPAVGAYNGGPGAMKRWVQASPYLQSDPDMFVERIPYEQSRDYIKKVFGSWWNYHRLYGSGNRFAL